VTAERTADSMMMSDSCLTRLRPPGNLNHPPAGPGRAGLSDSESPRAAAVAAAAAAVTA
jgi:hypothetical protein